MVGARGYFFYPPSAQARILFAQAEQPDSPAFNIVHAWSLPNEVDRKTLEGALRLVVQKHDLLRCIFAENEEGLSCEVLPQVECVIDHFLYSVTDEDVRGYVRRPFDLKVARAWRCGLFEKSQNKVELVLCLHHAIADDVSVDILCADWCEAYRRLKAGDFSSLPPSEAQYAQTASLERAHTESAAYRQGLSYLSAKLDGARPSTFQPHALPTSSREPIDGYCVVTVPESLRERVEEFCRAENATPYVFFSIIFGIVAARYAGEPTALFATAAGVRPARSMRRIVGTFVNTLPIAITIEGLGFRDVFRQARGEILRTLEYSAVPYEHVVRASGMRGRTQLGLRTMFLEKRPTPELLLEGDICIPNRPIWVGATKLDLTMSLLRRHKYVKLAVEYANAYFTEEFVQALLRCLINVAQTCLDHPSIRLTDVPLTSKVYAEEALTKSSGARVALSKAAIVDDILGVCTRSPDLIAASDANSAGVRRELSYRRLNQASCALAVFLDEIEVGPGSLIGVHMFRGIELSVAILAILRARCIYVPLDPDLPIARLRVQARGLSAVLTTTRHSRPDFDETIAWCQIDIEALATVPMRSRPGDGGDVDGDAFIIYTSGTTGEPKGVINTHVGLKNRLDWMQTAFPLAPGDVVLQKTPISFDVSVWELIWPLMVGARIHYARPGGHKDVDYLADVIVAEHVSVLHFVPSMLRVFLEYAKANHVFGVRHVICSGEQLSRQTAELSQQKFGGHVHNLYGPTEAAIDVTAFSYEPSERDGLVPIGYPIQNTDIYLLDGRRNLVPQGAVGDLYIGGVGLARGYYARPDLTAEKFIELPFGASTERRRVYISGDRARLRADGAIVFEGRSDGQIKLNGVRIEPDEIETILAAHPNVTDAAVVLQTGDDPFLAAYYRSLKGPISDAELRAWVLSRLPQSMTPRIFQWLEAFPINSSGKLDRRRLPRCERRPVEKREFVPAQTGIELLIAEIWEGILGVSPISIDDNFFALGGDSLRSLRIAAKMRTCGLLVQVSDLLDHPTIRGLARVAKLSPVVPDEPSIFRDEFTAPSVIQALWIAGQLKTDYRSYVTTYRIRGTLYADALQGALDAVVARHPMLRARLKENIDGVMAVKIERDARCRIEPYDLSAEDRRAAERRLQDWVEEVTRLQWTWDAAPLLKCVTHLLPGEEYQLTLVEPWLDGWSVQTLAVELFKNYVSLVVDGHVKNREPLRDNFSDFVEAERRARSDRDHIDYWRGRLAGLQATLAVQEAVDAPLVPIEVDIHAEGQRLRQIAADHSLPLKSLLLAVHCVAVSILVGRRAVTTGLTFNGRPETVGAEHTLGNYLNTLPIRVDLTSLSWEQLAIECLQEEARSTPWRRYPASEIRRFSDERLFDTLFNFTDFTVLREAPSVAFFQLIGRRGFDQTYTGLCAQFGTSFDGKRIELCLEVFEPLTKRIGAEHLARIYKTAMEAACAQFDASVEMCRSELISAYAPPNLQPSPRLSGEGDSLIDLFVKQAAATPDAIALRNSEGAVMTFRALARRAAAISRGLENAEIKSGTIIGVHLPRSFDFVASVLAIVGCGAIFLPLPVDAPVSRLAFMASDSGMRAAISLQDTGTEVLGIDTWSVEELAFTGEGKSEVWPRVRCSGLDGLHVLYTSGSTGRQKGVLTSHGVVLNRLRWMWREFPFNEHDVVAQKTSFAFVDCIWEIFGGLLHGIESYLVPEAVATDARVLADEIKRGRCTRIALVPSVMEAILRDCPNSGGELATLRVIVLSGEPLKTVTVTKLAARCPDATIVNLYGSTETGGDASFHYCSDTPGAPTVAPVGQPIDNCHIEILDEDGGAAHPGVVGEIGVSGACLCSGYVGWARGSEPRYSKSGRVVWPTGDLGYIDLQGVTQILGRRDRQIKVRGVRIDLAEIETALIGHEKVEECACGLDKAGLLKAYYRSSTGVPETELGAWLTAYLPSTHLPNRLIRVGVFPRTVSGKVDIRALEAASSGSLSRRVPTATESRIIAAINSLIEGQELDPSTNFFAVGGHSLLAASLVRNLRDIFGIDLPIRTVFDAPVVSALALLIERRLAQGSAGAVA